ncbi:MAG: hypothetical protein H6865_03390 [Rhodospirillales bacterium]|nr:hypothetical protein [Alphaproteobacteria bacterium]MCB9986660.1 hypothetical protein [Rhodospirillales bacterium]USO06812.1 MAG: hypothetical protein H6866_04995 [Rhodospirillales bacterium]
MSRILSLLAVCLLTLTLAACAVDRRSPDGYSTSRRDLTNYTYAATDALMNRAGRSVNKTTPLLVGTIGNVNDVESSSTLGRAITEQISARLAERGYKVAEMKLRQGISIRQGGDLDPAATGEYLLSRDVRDISGEHKAAAAIVGTYAVGADNVLVNLRLVDIRTGNVITGYDFTLPRTADIAAMSNTPSVRAPWFSYGRSF